MGKSRTPAACGKAWAFAHEQPGGAMAFSRLHVPASGTSPPVHLFQLCSIQNSMALSTREKCGISPACYGMTKLPQHHRTMVKTDSSYCPVHSCFLCYVTAISGITLSKKVETSNALEYSWGLLELSPLDTLLVQVVVLLTCLLLLRTGGGL